MDEMLEIFESALGTDSINESQTNFDGLYKNWGRLGNQEERRKEILEIQKSNRNNKLDKFRGILELVNAVEHNNIFKTNSRVYYRPNIYVAGFHRTSPSYSNVLMLSEWMIEKPEDFNENWFVVPCPKGVRMLVVANQGSTKCYTKHGYLKYQVKTALPGGNKQSKRSSCCVLDCFYYENLNTMYILDLLAWNNQPMTDGETEFRHFWLEQQLAEITDLQVKNKRNDIIFKIIPKTPCDPESFQKFMLSHPPFPQNCPALDGLLFYHKRAHYFAGQTPLVGWLYPYMVPEVIGSEIQLNDAYSIQKPDDYVNQAEFIQKFEEKAAKKGKNRRQRNSNSSSMDTGDSTTDETLSSEKSNSKKNNEENGKTMESEESEENKVNNSEIMESEPVTKTDKAEESNDKDKIKGNSDNMDSESPSTEKPEDKD